MFEENEFPKDCYNDAIKLVARREYSSKKISTKLLEKGYEPEEVLITVHTLKEKDFVNDQRYKESKIRYHLRRETGPKYIQNKLWEDSFSVSLDEIEEIAHSIEIDLDEILERLILKKAGSLKFRDYEESRKSYAKIMNFLSNRGFRASFDLLRDVVEAEDTSSDDHGTQPLD